MKEVLRKFLDLPLFDATSDFLHKLNVEFEAETAEPINVSELYEGPMPQYLADAMKCIKDTYFIGVLNDYSLGGNKITDSLEQITENIQRGGKYSGMFVFACDAYSDSNLTRSAASALTRAFNRIASANPVILLIRQGQYLSLATCERMKYSQEWRQGYGERLGKVSILRNINCKNPHRGHQDILVSLGDKAYYTFEDLYRHWMEVFSSELLTKKFYRELSDWYGWAVQIVKFPNDLRFKDDDARFNHEACIRLLTRLIFVWFLKQKHLIPEEFFDKKYISENLIDNFAPDKEESLYYSPGESKYYRLILQNLFFAMLNCPIVAEGKVTANNRRFCTTSNNALTNIMRYRDEFLPGGAEKLLKLANNNVPFLNGGLFDCLDDEHRNLYYDGFSERKECLEQLYFPDYLFFAPEEGAIVDLSQWYEDRKKNTVRVHGIVDILKRYCFTIEENTPYDQEVSLDPELLGKVFENLLAAYNPETKQSARNQTGSFYTPREIVQYMVNESLVAHLKRICGDDKEPIYRALLNYGSTTPDLSDDLRRSIMHAIYNCRVLDPACGSGAFPMGVLQQMVHVLKQLDHDNELWNSMIIDIAVEDERRELLKLVNGEEDKKQEVEKAYVERRKDIESVFQQSIKYPDYARKLFLIEHCIYGVDIQPIATQISKLRFFISLVVDQDTTSDPRTNFGIRPLPNLEAKFVTANTLIPLDRSRNIFTGSEDVLYYEELLNDINHRIFLAKKNSEKKKLQEMMFSARANMAQVMDNLGAFGPSGYNQLMSWNMFDQNTSSSFFDTEWMFGLKEGFDVVIGNPPYIQIKWLPEKEAYREVGYKTFDSSGDIYCLFYEVGVKFLSKKGYLTYITSNKWLKSNYGKKTRNFIVQNTTPKLLLDLGAGIFENATVDTNIIVLENGKRDSETKVATLKSDIHNLDFYNFALKENEIWNIANAENVEKLSIKEKVEKITTRLSDFNVELNYGILTGANKTFILSKSQAESLISLDSKNREIIKPILRGKDLERYSATFNDVYILCTHNGVRNESIPRIDVERDYPSLIPYFESFGEEFFNRGEQGDTCYNLRNCAFMTKYLAPKILYADIVQDTGKFYLDEDNYFANDTAFMITGDNLYYLTGILNSKTFTFLYKNFYCGGALGKKGLRYKRDFLLTVPVPKATLETSNELVCLVKKVQDLKKNNKDSNTTEFEKKIEDIVYGLYGLSDTDIRIIEQD